MTRWLVAAWLALGVVMVAGAQRSGESAVMRPRPTVTRIADGVFLFQTEPYGEVGLDGNAVAIIGTDAVLVFDSNGTPAAAAAVLREIRSLTSAPVRFVVNSHWHWDHWYGTEVYRDAVPDVQVIAHEKTRAMMMGPAIEFNRPGLDQQLPGYIGRLRQRLATMPSSPESAALAKTIQAHEWFLAQKRAATLVWPTLTYADQLTVYLGDREVQIKHIDRAVTPGDTLLYLPRERIVMAGDLLVNPVSFALSVYPSGWIRTLEWLDAQEATIIVPGHGAALHDEVLLHATLDVFRQLHAFGRDAKARGLTPYEASDQVWPTLHDAMVTLTHDDPAINQAFRVQLVEWFMHRVFQELDGPLDDSIAPIPSRR